jgi:hypothetical protein
MPITVAVKPDRVDIVINHWTRGISFIYAKKASISLAIDTGQIMFSTKDMEIPPFFGIFVQPENYFSGSRRCAVSAFSG